MKGRALRRAMAATLVLLCAGRGAWAQTSPLELRVGASTAWDSNVFRVADTVADPQSARGISGRSDRSATTSVGLHFRKAWSQQQVSADLSRSSTQFDRFSFLDSDVSTTRGEWQWRATPWVSGALSASRTKTPVPFDETRDLEPNFVINTTQNFTLTGRLPGGWEVLGGLSGSERRYTRPFFAEPDSRQSGGEAGLRYGLASGSAFTALQKVQRGTSTGATAGALGLGAGDFEVDETELTARWVASGRSTLNGRFSWTERRRADAPERNFSGRGGELSHLWTATGRLSLASSFSRTLAPFLLGITSSYRVDDTLTLAPSWQFSEKVRLSARLVRQETHFRGSIVASAAPERHDVLSGATLSLDWLPVRSVIFSAALRRDSRESNEPLFGFRGTVFTLNASLTL